MVKVLSFFFFYNSLLSLLWGPSWRVRVLCMCVWCVPNLPTKGVTRVESRPILFGSEDQVENPGYVPLWPIVSCLCNRVEYIIN